MFSNPFPNAFGLDIGDLSIKIVQLTNVSHLHRKPSYNLATARSIRLPHGIILDGVLQNPEKVRHYIQHLLGGIEGKYKPIKSPWVVATLPETQAFIKLITISKPKEEIIEDDITEAIKKHIPLDQEEDAYYIDWQIISTNEELDKQETKILVGITQKIIADSYTYLLESLGLGVMALEIEALAIARSMITAQKHYQNEARALLDIGATRSSEIVTTALSQKLKISYEEAEKIKINQGVTYEKGQKNTKAWNVITETTEQLVKQIEKSINFYYSHFKNSNKITHITMCGGGSAMTGLDKILTSKLNIESMPGKPWKNLLSKKEIPMHHLESLSYSTAIGLALRASDNPFFKHDII